MAVCFETFLDWAQDRFGDLKVKGNEIKTHSIFTDDAKYKLWMNPSGGKKQRQQGCYRCWLTDKRGSLVSLVSEIDGISYDEAEELICDNTSLTVLHKKIDEYFKKFETSTNIEEPIVLEEKEEFNLPFGSFLVSEINKSYYGKRAIDYLQSRKLPEDGLYVGTSGKFRDRIIIPYYDVYGDLVYYNARAINPNEKMRYLKPESNSVNRESILYVPEWPKPNKKIYVMEGEFDAISLNLIGFKSAACGGKFLYEDQVEILRNFKVVLSFDNDEAGKRAVMEIGSHLLSKGFKDIYHIRPPRGYKDWNALLQEKSIPIIRDYIVKNEKLF